MKIIKLICEHCKKEFEKPDYFIRSELKKKKDHKFFCSKECVYANRTVLKKIKVNCTYCKKECITDENDLKRNKNYYCSWTCYEAKRNIGKTIIDLTCAHCGNIFQNSINQYNGKKRKGRKNIFCTAKCSSEAQRNDYSKPFTVKCDHCGNDVIRTGRQLKITKFHFCTPSCKGSYFARIYALGEKRSLLEQRLGDHIKNSYPNLKFIINDREELKGLELDFYFPTINFAIEVNGPAHFTPIYGDESLIRTQKHDIIKKTMCAKKRIRLLEITDKIDYNDDNSNEIFEKYVKPIIEGLLI